MSETDNLLPALQAFMVYWQHKRRLDPHDQATVEALSQARQAYNLAVPEAIDPDQLLKDWETDFQEIESRFHHQGG